MSNSRNSSGGVVASVIFAFIAFMGMITAFLSYYTIDEGQRGVILRTGKVVGVSDPGLHFKVPFVDSVEKITTRSQAIKFKGQAYTKDQQTTSFIISVNFNIPASKVSELYSKYRGVEEIANRLLERVVPTQAKNIFGQYNAHNAISERPRLIAQIEEAIKLSAKDEPILIESVQVEDIEFSKAYETSIEQRMMAEVAVTTQKQNLEKEKVSAEIKITQARGEAEAKLAQAEAEAKAILVRGEAEAKAIKLKSEALNQNPSLVALTAAERWNGELPKTMLPNSSLPMINLNEEVKTTK